MRLVFVILILFSLGAKAQDPFSRDLWLNEANAPVKVNALIQDDAGYVWVGTDIGIFYFNGRNFTTVKDNISKPVTALANINGKVWAGYANGTIGFVKEDILRPVVIKNIAPRSAITHIYSDVSDILWICTEQQGIIAVVNDIGVSFTTSNGLSDNFVYMASVLPSQRMIAATDRGITEAWFEKGRLKTNIFSTANGLPDNIVRVLKRMPDKAEYWIGMQQGGIAIYNAETRKIHAPYGKDTGWKWGEVNDILPMSDDRAWIATSEGYMLEVQLKDSNGIDTRPYYYPGKNLKRLLLGKSGVIWTATDQGITSITAEYMSYIPMPPPFKLSEIKAMTCDKSNMLWYAQDKRLFRMSLNKFNAQPEMVWTAPATITCLYADDNARLWIGTFGAGLLYRENTGAVNPVTDIEPLKNENILDITGTYDRLWVSGLNGVEELSYPGTYTKKMLLLRKHNKHSGLGSDYVYQLYPDRKGRIWMATDGGGVCMYGEGRYKRWSAADGLNSQVVYTITEDAKGNIWAATLLKGLYRFDGEKWQEHSHEQGLQDLNISTIAANATGQVVVVHSKGIDVWYPNSGQFRNYNKRPNLINIDSTSNVLKLMANDEAGNVYIPFNRGFVVFKNLKFPYDIKPSVKISGLSVFFKPVPYGKQEFDHDQNHISMQFDGVNFANPEHLHYRYKLEGYNDRWIVTNDESVTFPQLTTGRYKFRVQASLNNTFSRQGEASYLFSIAKPFWRRVWFILLMSAIVIGIALSYIRFREENLRKVSSLQRERMMFEYEHLKSQVNPHFLFNSLNTLTNLIEEDRDIAMSYTSRLSDLYRNMLSYRDKDLIYLYEEWEILENYMYIQKSRFGKALDMKVKVADELMYMKKIVPLALQLLVENAIKHNIVSQSTPLTITIEATEDSITVRNPLQPKISREKGAGLGLINVRKRYTLLSKKQIAFGIKNNEYIVTLPLL
jgi:ligand-binding sensor domain-containing protein